MLKYEVRNCGLHSQLIVKNIKNSDFTTFSCQCHGVRLSAQLRQQSPFMCPVRSEIHAFPTGIEVIRTKVRPGTCVKWYRDEELITPQSFRLFLELIKLFWLQPTLSQTYKFRLHFQHFKIRATIKRRLAWTSYQKHGRNRCYQVQRGGMRY